ncbi:hypothetical protein GCM10023085_17240 [Actinomadura viridis]|uniref:Uncharacterized protein n=1 Tax=Actinomadura viridis TaxID=58110 RepID=A0A931DG91_9ACTN|nr:DUF6297 family protein [Actinomadura viridis]MBG6089515.1 hypothetical protein [Actinomadura viridis]
MTGVASMTAVRAHVRARGRRGRTWSDRYTSLLGLALTVVIAAPAVGTVLSSVPREVDPSRACAGVALLALLLAGALSAARAFGPVALPSADAAWLVLSPLPRRGVLARTALILVGVSVVVGAVAGVGLLTVLGTRDQVVLRLLAALVLGVATMTGGMSAAVLAQASERWDAWLTGAITVIVVSAGIAAIMSFGPGRHLAASAVSAPPSAVLAAATASAVLATGLAVRAWTVLGRIPARAVLDASTRTGHAAAAAVVMDPGALTWIVEDAHWRGRSVRSRPWPSGLAGGRLPARVRGPLAVAWQEWRRLARRPARVVLLASSTLLPALAARAAPEAAGGDVPVVAGVVLGVGALAAAAAATTGARRDGDDPALARLLGVGPRALLAARAVLPALLGGGWLVAALTVLGAAGALPAGPWWLLGAACAPALAAGALRMARRRPVDHAMPVLSTPVGALPTGPVLWALTGVDVAVLGCVPALTAFAGGMSTGLLAAQAVWGAAVLAAYLGLRGRRY